ncbi:DUF2069 domain-containing protein [Balneatrix alpica]|uniref:DUF2069 domain-containing protein n=1 Tax=Balneatrix alpica TaxID=75684 RepID=A0ABV5Z8L5_9GAMM|nr:DUF2069 domain-containing protein [Balneatrix alpica]
MSAPAPFKLRLCRLLVMSCLPGLIALYSAWYLWILPPQGISPWLPWGLHALPLLLFLPSISQGKLRPHAWLCFLLLLYFTSSVLALMIPTKMLLAAVELTLICLLFTAAMMYTRWQSRWLKGELN